MIQQEKSLHGPADFEEVQAVEDLVYKDPAVQAEIAKLNLEDNSLVVCEPWSYGKQVSRSCSVSEGSQDTDRRFQVAMGLTTIGECTNASCF